jgi:hypothetical protein
MNTVITQVKNPCRSVQEYKMLPIEKSNDAYTIKRPPLAPRLGPRDPLIHFRILKIEDNVATICADMTKLVDGQLTVRDVNVTRLSVRVDDIIGFKESDVQFLKPLITHRRHQKHQHPHNLVTESER